MEKEEPKITNKYLEEANISEKEQILAEIQFGLDSIDLIFERLADLKRHKYGVLLDFNMIAKRVQNHWQALIHPIKVFLTKERQGETFDKVEMALITADFIFKTQRDDFFKPSQTKGEQPNEDDKNIL